MEMIMGTAMEMEIMLFGVAAVYSILGLSYSILLSNLQVAILRYTLYMNK